MSIACITCGGAVPDDSEFCPACGRAVQLVEPRPSGRSAEPVRPEAATRPQMPTQNSPAPTRTRTAAPPVTRARVVPERPAVPPRTAPGSSVRSRAPVERAGAVARESSSEIEDDPKPGPPVIWNDRLFAAAAYFTFIPAVVLLFVKPYAQRKFVRFHSLQSVLFWVLVAVLIGIGVLASTFGFLLLWLFTGALVMVGLILTWLVLAIKALQGDWFQLPGLGPLAAQYAAVR